MAAVFFVLSLGVALRSFGNLIPLFSRHDGLLLPGMTLHLLPIISGLRVFARFGVVVFLALSVWVAVNLEQTLWPRGAPRERWKRWGVALALAAGVLLERFHGPQELTKIADASAYSALRSLPDQTVLLGLPLEAAPAMLQCQTWHGQAMVNYFGARVAPSIRAGFEASALYRMLDERRALAPERRQMLSDPRAIARARADLRRLGVTRILIHHDVCAPAMRTALDRLIRERLRWRPSPLSTDEYSLYAPPGAPSVR